MNTLLKSDFPNTQLLVLKQKILHKETPYSNTKRDALKETDKQVEAQHDKGRG